MSRKPLPSAKPRRLSPAELEAFGKEVEAKGAGVDADSGNQDSGTSDSPTHEASGGKGVKWRRKRDGRAMRATTIHFPSEVARKLRERCATDDRKISDAVTEAVTAWLEGTP